MRKGVEEGGLHSFPSASLTILASTDFILKIPAHAAIYVGHRVVPGLKNACVQCVCVCVCVVLLVCIKK